MIVSCENVLYNIKVHHLMEVTGLLLFQVLIMLNKTSCHTHEKTHIRNQYWSVIKSGQEL